MLDLVNGYLGLKVKGMLHNDLKPQNIFIKNKFFKIGDFGLSVKLSHCNEEVQCGTIVYAAPEKLNPLAENTDIDHKSDIFSIGLILF
jgi:serine/threonine protein kinase